MEHSLSPWAIVAQEDLNTNSSLLDLDLDGYKLSIKNTGDSIWLKVYWPSGGRIAFRVAFAMNSTFERVMVNEVEGEVVITTTTRLGKYRIHISFPESVQPLLRYTTAFEAANPMFIPFSPRDIIPLTKDGEIQNTLGTIHAAQVGGRSGQMFFSMTRPANGSVFYFQNLTAISPYCEATETSLMGAVGGQWPEIGFQLPAAIKKPLPGKTEFIVSDAFILLSEDIPQDEVDIAKRFINAMAAIYTVMPKPDTKYCDWIDISEKALHELTFNKGCWTYAKGHPYLNAYLCDYKTPAEIMVQLAVLYAIMEHSEWTGEKYPVIKEIERGMEAFYDPKLKTISRWLPSQRGNLDDSEEQKKPMTMDSWYLHHPLLNLSKLALEGDKMSKDLLLESLEYAILVAHRFDYEWPVFYKMDTLEILKAETQPGKGGEKDVAGGYALLMLNVWKLTDDQRYFKEAVKAAKKLAENGMEIFYQGNMTAFSALAMLRLFKETDDPFYLDVSYLCMAGIFKNVQLWECDYGSAKHFVNFFGVFPLSDAPYKAAYEEMEVYAALNDYIKEATTMEAPILDSLRMLIPEFVKYSVNRLSSYFPPLLPPDILSEEVKTGEVDPQLWIPIEDLYDGWEKHGQVGQEVYGAGVGFGVVPRQYIKVPDGDFLIFTEYPVRRPQTKTKNAITFSLIGDPRFTSAVIMIPINDTELPNVSVTLTDTKSETIDPSKSSNKAIEYKIPGGATIRVKWNKKRA
jgi:hypothetical protein